MRYRPLRSRNGNHDAGMVQREASDAPVAREVIRTGKIDREVEGLCDTAVGGADHHPERTARSRSQQASGNRSLTGRTDRHPHVPCVIPERSVILDAGDRTSSTGLTAFSARSARFGWGMRSRSLSIRTRGLTDEGQDRHLRLLVQPFRHRRARMPFPVFEFRVIRLRDLQPFRGLFHRESGLLPPRRQGAWRVRRNAFHAHVRHTVTHLRWGCQVLSGIVRRGRAF